MFEKSKLKNTVQNTQPELFKLGKIKRIQEWLGSYHALEETKNTKESGKDSGIERSHSWKKKLWSLVNGNVPMLIS